MMFRDVDDKRDERIPSAFYLKHQTKLKMEQKDGLNISRESAKACNILSINLG
jgi:hypothetical protein